MARPPPLPGVSLKRQLLLWLLLPQLVLWLTGGVLAWRVALENGERGIDQSLTQSVKALARQIKPIGDGLLVDFPKAAQDILEQDPTDRISYMVSSPPGRFLLGNAQLPPPPADKAQAEPGEAVLYAGVVDKRPVRVVSLEVDYGSPGSKQRLRVQVAQSLTVRERIAHELLEKILLPMGLMGLVLSALVYAGVLRGLRPLKRLEAEIELIGASPQPGHAPLPSVALSTAPQEVHSLASTINRLLAAVARGQIKEKQFLNDAAHQLRTPLAGLIGQTDLALHEMQDSPARERLIKVRAAAQRSAHLVHQLLQLARSETTVELQALDLPGLAREVARDWTGRALAAGVDLGYEGEEQLTLQGNPLLLREALSNLLDNALHYAGPGSVVTVRVRRLATDQAELSVEDNGPGLPADQLPHLFQRFWRGSEKAGGCGLGLAIVEEIAQRHHGEAFAHAQQPQGLQVGLRLPVEDVARQQAT
ncbi:MAG: sensor histidine kinase [Curvibacter sp.]|nr:MAG: sensor histidine kinase [Curvibacter sp.]